MMNGRDVGCPNNHTQKRLSPNYRSMPTIWLEMKTGPGQAEGIAHIPGVRFTPGASAPPFKTKAERVKQGRAPPRHLQILGGK